MHVKVEIKTTNKNKRESGNGRKWLVIIIWLGSFFIIFPCLLSAILPILGYIAREVDTDCATLGFVPQASHQQHRSGVDRISRRSNL